MEGSEGFLVATFIVQPKGFDLQQERMLGAGIDPALGGCVSGC